MKEDICVSFMVGYIPHIFKYFPYFRQKYIPYIHIVHRIQQECSIKSNIPYRGILK